MKAFAMFVVLVLSLSVLVAQESTAAEPYDVNEAYEVYGALLPRDPQYGLAKRTVVIQQETISTSELRTVSRCVGAEAAEKFKDAIADFARVNRKPWLLQRRFELDKPYELVSSDAIRALFGARRGGGDNFDQRYPDSGRYAFNMSAVGFNRDKTQAIVYSGSYCGGLCGRWNVHLFEKRDGKWKRVPTGAVCLIVS